MMSTRKSTAVNFDDAFEIVMSSARVLGTERVSIENNGALNRILAEDIVFDNDLPPVNKSLRDGFACRRADLDNKLTLIETIPAGVFPKKAVRKNECAKIMTGAIVPEGADCVIMVEHVENIAENKIRFIGSNTENNISVKGEYFQKGGIVLRAGSRIGAAQIAVLASTGHVNPLVALRPRVGIIATGSELIEPGQKPSFCQVRNSNGFQLAAQAASTSAIIRNYGIVADKEDIVDRVFKKALKDNDVVISSGGISAGEYDFVRDILRKNGVRLLFERIAVNIGRPVVFGVSKDALCFGLPGTPISAFIMFELLAKPLLYNMMGYDFKPVITRMRIEKAIARKNAGKDTWLPVRFITNHKVSDIKCRGSGHIGELCQTDGLLCIPAGIAELDEGSIVNIRLI